MIFLTISNFHGLLHQNIIWPKAKYLLDLSPTPPLPCTKMIYLTGNELNLGSQQFILCANFIKFYAISKRESGFSKVFSLMCKILKNKKLITISHTLRNVFATFESASCIQASMPLCNCRNVHEKGIIWYGFVNWLCAIRFKPTYLLEKSWTYPISVIFGTPPHYQCL